MKLNELLKTIRPLAIEGNAGVEITGVDIDSRRVEPGHLFVAIKGTQTDGHAFMDKAASLGAAAILCETMPDNMAEGVTYVKVASTEDAVGSVATIFYGEPSKKLKLVGVTGTNGKTTIATLLYDMFRKLVPLRTALHRVQLYRRRSSARKPHHARPDRTEPTARQDGGSRLRIRVHGMLKPCHSTEKNRRPEVCRRNIYQSDPRSPGLPQDFRELSRREKAFFDSLPKDAFAITNADDKNGMVMTQNTKATVKTYSTRTMADFKAKIIECHFEGMYLEIDGREVGVQFIGKFNVSNLLAVYVTAVMLGKQPEDILVAQAL